jgi:ferredoxin
MGRQPERRLVAYVEPAASETVTHGEGVPLVRAPEIITEGLRVGTALPRRAPASTADNNRGQLARLHRFHLGDPRAGESEEGVAGYLPALLGPYRDVAKLRFDYPLVLHDATPVLAEYAPDQIATPLTELLRIASASIGKEATGERLLRDNLDRLESIVQEAVTDRPAPATEVLRNAAERMQNDLALDPQNRSRLDTAVGQLLAMLPPEGVLLGYSRLAGVHLLLHAIGHRLIPRHERFRETLQGLVQHLRELLRIERTKAEDLRPEQQGRLRVGSAGGRFLDAEALARVVGHRRGSRPMPGASRRRIEEALGVLEAQLAVREVDLVTIVHSGLPLSDLRNGGLPFVLHTTPQRQYRVQAQSGLAPCIETEALFDERAAQFAQVIGAVRTAQLEVEGLYDLEAYEPWLDTRSWKDLTREELQLLPTVVALISADLVVGDGMRAISRLLRSGRPVQLLVEVEPSVNAPGFPEEQALTEHRLEIGYFGLCHRHAWVQQSSAARPQHLVTGYLTALDEACTGLHILSAEDSGQRAGPSPIHPWLLAGSAIEARGHPLFHFHPSGSRGVGNGDGFGRLDLQGNPQPACDWPAHELRYFERDGTQQSLALQFTFADFALLHPKLWQHFRLLPEGVETEALVTVETYLSREGDANRQALPFIWVVDKEGRLRRALIARELLRATEDRQNYWRTLQAFAGVRNPHVENVQKQMQAEILERLAAQREQLNAAHRNDLEQVRQEAARQAMKRLAEALVRRDLAVDGFVPGTACQALPPAPSPEETSASQPEAATPKWNAADEPPNADGTIEEPWIDTPLCTSCNDCLSINPQLFVYDENKQARINDPRAGTYAQLVEAAEQCPARCIHPGLPLDPDEPDVDALTERAAPFN